MAINYGQILDRHLEQKPSGKSTFTKQPGNRKEDNGIKQKARDRTWGQAPPEEEWNFPKLCRAYPVSPGMWNYWLNYEYARSCRPIVEQVLTLRCRQIVPREDGTLPDRNPGSRFAAFLHRYFPEFPATPWHLIPAASCRQRLKDLDLDLNDDPFTEPILRVHDPHIFCDQVALGDWYLDSEGKRADRMGIFEINLTRTSKQIRQRFQVWLKRRLEELEKKTGAPIHHSNRRANVGQSANHRIYKTYLKRLGTLRLVKHFGWNWSTACSYSAEILHSDPDGKGLFANKQTAWERPQDRALDLLRRLECAWTGAYFPPFILRPLDFQPFSTQLVLRKKFPDDDAAAQASQEYAPIRADVLGYTDLLELRARFSQVPPVSERPKPGHSTDLTKS